MFLNSNYIRLTPRLCANCGVSLDNGLFVSDYGTHRVACKDPMGADVRVPRGIDGGRAIDHQIISICGHQRHHGAAAQHLKDMRIIGSIRLSPLVRSDASQYIPLAPLLSVL